ncbi:MAG: SHOCT domain-containing protein, partial [Clostridia bacterium]
TDLSVIALILTIFSLGIVAYALMQDQVNKLYNGYVAPAYGATPNGCAQPPNNGYTQPQNGGYAQPQNNGFTQPQNNGYTQPQNGGYTQPQNGGYTQPQNGGYTQPQNNAYTQPQDPVRNEPIHTETEPAVETADLGAQAQNLKLLKELLDNGILTQEEFEAKKKDILGL